MALPEVSKDRLLPVLCSISGPGESSYFAQVKPVYDLYRLINTLHKYKDNEDEHLCIKYDGVNALEQFVLAKYYMINQVYYHKIRRVTDAMLKRGIELGIENDNINFLKKFYFYKNEEDYFEHYLDWWDDKFFVELSSKKHKGYSQTIFNKLYERDLFKIIYSIDLKQLRRYIKAPLRRRILDIDSPENEKLKKKMELMIAKALKIEPKEYVIANSITIKSVREMSRDSEGAVAVEKKNGKISNFEQESKIFQSIDESLKEVLFEIYAPVGYKDQRDKSKKLEIISFLDCKKRSVIRLSANCPSFLLGLILAILMNTQGKGNED